MPEMAMVSRIRNKAKDFSDGGVSLDGDLGRKGGREDNLWEQKCSQL